jgi:hypothetical protein
MKKRFKITRIPEDESMAPIEEEIIIEDAGLTSGEKLANKRRLAKHSITAAAATIIAGSILIFATKKLFDEVFVEDDWSDVDWGEEEDLDLSID